MQQNQALAKDSLYKREKGWYSDSLRFRNCEDIEPAELQKHVQSVTGILSFENCPKANLLFTLSQIKFPNIISLQLPHNNIMSIQGITRYFMPSLKQIRLCSNNIAFIKDIRKGHWPRLQFLNLKQNKIVDFHFLTELYIPGSFQSLTLSTRKQSEINAEHDIAWIAKLQPNKMNNINTNLWGSYDSSSLVFKFGVKLAHISHKFVRSGTFATSNCFDLH